MSNSVFKEYPSERKSDDILNDNLKVDSNLVIVVNKDGSVCVDQNTLKSVLADETTNTSVSVIRVSSPTPSIEDEIEQERKKREIKMLGQESENEDAQQMSTTSFDEDNIPHVSITVEGFYPPGEEAKRFANEVLSLAGLQHPLKIETIDYEFQKYVIQNDHCYTPLTSPSQRLPKSNVDDEIPLNEIVKPPTKTAEEPPPKKKAKSVSATKKPPKKPVENESEQDTDSNSVKETVDETDYSDYTEETPTTSEDDHDSDLDFSVTQSRRKSRKPGKGGNRSILKGSRTVRKKSSTVTDNDVENMVREIESAHEKTMRKKAALKHLAKKSPSSSKHGHKSSKSNIKKESDAGTSTSTVVVPPKPEPVKDAPISVGVKKEKKASAHMEALFSDMSSLFSSPDIIKKVGNKQEHAVHQTHITSTKGFVPLCPSSAKNIKIPGQISIKTHPSSIELNSSNTNVDLLDSLVQTKQEKQEIFDIVKTLEEPLDSSMISNSSSHMGDSSILDNDDQNSILDDGLPEDLLQHVAELAENKEIQEIIDKQVLGVMSTSTDLNTQSLNSSRDASTSGATVPQGAQSEQIKRVSPPTMSVKEQLMPRKEPIQIRRSDGRIITLPPIEAPATRGATKRKAQVSTPVPEKPIIKEHQVKTSSITSTPIATKAKDTHKTVADSAKSTSRRNSAANKSTSESKDGKHRKSSTGIVAVLETAEDEIDSDESWNSEDDPDRLWCICKQPHNNRFMICCDSCEDWFHGKCVNVTKQMGQQMEEEGIEWTCPNCLPKKGGKQQTKLTDFMMKAGVAGSSASSPKQSNLSCVVCKKPSRPNSIYCSDDCIRKHAQNATKPSIIGKSEIKKSESSKNETVIVMDKKTGRYLAGKSAPTMENLKQWLREHPTYEVVEKGSAQAIAIKAKQMQLKQLSKDMSSKEGSSSPQANKIQTTIKFNDQKKLVYVSPAGKTPKTPVSKSSPITPTSSSKKEKEAPKPAKRQRTTSESKPTTPNTKQSGESIRVTCRTHMKEQIKLRISDGEVTSKLTDTEIDKFVSEVEREMFVYFNRDTGMKYKAKYRSLIFNIKDRKNKSLFQKICEKSIEPKQLVHMTPEEMASQELTQWRVNENKHQLEMIKKSELDLLAASKNYVLKTHKGEEVIEDNKMKRVELDPMIAVEDVVTVLNNSTVSSTTEIESTAEFSGKHKEYDLTYGKSYGLTPSSSSSSANIITSAILRNKESRRSRSRDRTKSSSKHKRKRSRERSRERSRDRERHKSRDHKKDDKKDERKEDKKHDKKKEHQHHSSSHHHSHHHEHTRDHSSSKEKERDHEKATTTTMSPKSIKEEKKYIKKDVKPKIENFSLVDQILEASTNVTKSEKDHNEIKEEKKDPPQSTKIEGKPHRISSDQEQEPTSTVTIPTPPHSIGFENEEPELLSASPEPVATPIVLWSGNIHYIDVATFEITVENVSGDCEETFNDFPEEMDICGTIKPEIVWDYIEQIKKSPNKEICVVRLTSFDSTAYETLYHHLHLRRRFCVIKPTSSQIKDFYLFSLPAERDFPAILLPMNGPGIVEGESKPDLLLGVLIKIKGKRHASTADSSHLHKAKKLAHSAVKQVALPKNYSTKVDEHFTPPSSPKASHKIDSKSKLMLGLPTDLESDSNSNDKKHQESLDADDDEPYSPADSDETFSDITEIIDSSKNKRKTTREGMDASRLQKEMEELNRRIAEEKNQIVGIIKKSDIDEDEIKKTLPSSLIGIALPSNLKDILKSINIVGSSKVETPILESNMIIDDDEEYVPECPSSSLLGYKSVGFSYTATSTSSVDTPPKNTTSKLATLTDEELLNMVPDDAKIPMPDDSPMEIVDDKELDEDDEDHFEDVDEIKGVTNTGVLKTIIDVKTKDNISENKSSENFDKEKQEEEDGDQSEKLESRSLKSPPPKRMKWIDTDEPPPPGIDDFDDDL